MVIVPHGIALSLAMFTGFALSATLSLAANHKASESTQRGGLACSAGSGGHRGESAEPGGEETTALNVRGTVWS